MTLPIIMGLPPVGDISGYKNTEYLIVESKNKKILL